MCQGVIHSFEEQVLIFHRHSTKVLQGLAEATGKYQSGDLNPGLSNRMA